MKDETKYLIAWIKGVISNCPYIAMPDSIRADSDEKKEDAIKLLDSFPDIESHLCSGGYIQDKNGTPCCHGDKVKFQYDECFYNGTLTFNFTFKCFTIVNENGVFFWINNDIKWFEKEEN